MVEPIRASGFGLRKLLPWSSSRSLTTTSSELRSGELSLSR